MGDALRPGDDEFNQVLHESLKTWTSYLATEKKTTTQATPASHKHETSRQPDPAFSR